MLPARKMVIETYGSIEQVDGLKVMYYCAAAKVCIWLAIRSTQSLSSAWSAGTACTPTVTDWAVVRHLSVYPPDLSRLMGHIARSAI